MRALGIALVALVGCRQSPSAMTDRPRVEGSGSAAPASEMGATPAAKQFDAWLAVFNKGDRAALVAYHAQQFPYAVASNDIQGVEREAGLSSGTGGFDVKIVERPSPTQIIVTMKEKHSDQIARATMDVDPVEPHHVTKFEIHPIPTPPELLSPELAALQRIDDKRRRAVVDAIAREIDAHYVAPDVGAKMIAAMRDHLARGDYDAITQAPDLAAALTKDLREVSHDKHLGVDFMPRRPNMPPPSPDAQREMRRDMAKRANYGFGAIERMPNNIARVEILGFPPILDDDSRAAVGEQMSKVADADAVIFDLRNNGGGSPDTVALFLSYVFDKPTHINSMYSRDTGKTEESWTLSDVKGKRFGGKKPVFVVTSNRTFSGGEEFTYDLQTQRRATIVGETTGGGAHPVEGHPLEGGFGVRVPWGRPINPVTKKDWEGTGVVPDVSVAADAALDQAHQLAVAELARRSGPHNAPR